MTIATLLSEVEQAGVVVVALQDMLFRASWFAHRVDRKWTDSVQKLRSSASKPHRSAARP